VMQSNCMLLAYPQGPISECPRYFHDILHNGPFALCYKEWLVITVCWIAVQLIGGILEIGCLADWTLVSSSNMSLHP
jgi:hypothetical protein